MLLIFSCVLCRDSVRRGRCEKDRMICDRSEVDTERDVGDGILLEDPCPSRSSALEGRRDAERDGGTC